MKRLIFNADDFGMTRGVNEGIVRAHREGILTSATLMANGLAFDDAAKKALENDILVGRQEILCEPQQGSCCSYSSLVWLSVVSNI